MRTITADELGKILEEHRLWLDTEGATGARADLSDIDLRGANMTGAVFDPSPHVKSVETS